MPAREKIKANCWGSSWPVDTRGRSRKRRMRRRRSRRTRWRWRRRRWPWSRVCAGSGFCPGLGLAWRGPAAEPTSDSSSPQFLPGGQPGRLLVSLSYIARAVSPLWGMDQCCDHTCHVSRVTCAACLYNGGGGEYSNTNNQARPVRFHRQTREPR